MILLAGRASRGARRIIPAIAGALSLLITLVGLAERAPAAELVGATAGELGVSAEGSANYSIEIAVPPGTTGVQPKLSLNYDSQAGNGALGVGFSLGGLSAIMRIAASAIVGGTSSVLTGGKFVNGAVTAAFARMFNEEMHRSDATCGAAAGGAAAMCIGTAAAGVSCRRRVRHAPSPLQRR
jgi:virulence plasmid B protein